MHLEIRHLRLVAAIAETGSVTRAAERVYLTQSAVSHQLKEIEARLGTSLFLRTGKRMVLSAAGERVLLAAGGILRELENVERDIQSDTGLGPEGILRVATECYTCYHWLPAALRMFQSDYPRVEVRVVPDATRRTLRALTTGEIDVAIVSRQPATRRLRYVSLFKDELVIVAHPEHPILERKFVRPADLAGEPLVLYTMPDENSTLLHDVLRPAGVKPGPITRVQLTEGIVELVKANFGITLMARWAAAPHLEAGTLAAVSVGRTGFNREWVAAVRTRGDTPAHVDGFLNALGRISFFGSTKQKTTRGRARLSA